ncbi:MAG: hypothetical protein ACE5EG_07685 [Thermoanaerobaculia bacterium]
MNRRLNKAVNRWLLAERGDSGDAETRLRRVFQALPAPRLPEGFAERVLSGTGLMPQTAAAPLGWRIALGGALLLSAAAAAAAPRIVLGLMRWVTPGDVLRLAADAVVETCRRLAEGLALWQTANSIGDTFAEVLSTPAILTALLAATLLSAGGLRMLHGLLAVDRRRENARA